MPTVLKTRDEQYYIESNEMPVLTLGYKDILKRFKRVYWHACVYTEMRGANDEINDLFTLCGIFMWYFMQDNSIVSRLYVLQ